ncbi:MAG TPA: hypothetical protein VFG49_14920 [Dyella sp.]|uniref:hypothetical protein n=1 Tax=Dyella sp. TaxID=1869338 RepID=UPI002D7701EC|nr:hypothetical protein [Dyella sp.]HET6554816.1 hypothetical protein [Dyella sp.]
MDSAILTFAALNARIDALPDHESLSVAPSRRQRWGYIIGFGAGFIGLLAAKLFPNSKVALGFAAVMLVVEVCGLLLAVTPRGPWTRRRLPGFATERRDFAEQLDFDLYHYEQIIAWLVSFPKERLEAMAQYATQRHESLKDKHPLISGGLEKLGALPLAAVLFLQFKDLHWPPQPTWPEFLLGVALVSLYWGSLLLVSVRFRTQLFALLLTEAAKSATDLRRSGNVAETA